MATMLALELVRDPRPRAVANLERRAANRYPLTMPILCKTQSVVNYWQVRGNTINISSSGVAFEVQDEDNIAGQILIRSSVVLELEWASDLDGSVPLKLVAQGRIVRIDKLGGGKVLIAASFQAHVFRTRGPKKKL